MARRIDCWADVCCPFTYVGLVRLLAARDERGSDASVVVHAWPLELVNDRPLDPHHVGREIEAIVASVAPDLFAGFDASTFPATSLPAMALAAQAYAAGGTALGEAVSMDLRRAVFESGQDVSQPDVLDAIAAAHGIDRDDGGGSAVPPVVADDYAQGRARGVIGSPHFFVEGADWFCPVLEISQSDGVFHVETSPEAVATFLDTCLGPDA